MNNHEKSGWIVIGISLGGFVLLVVLAALFAPGFQIPERVRWLGNLRQIEIAKEVWAQQCGNSVGTAVSTNDLLPLIAKHAILRCPNSGTYSLGAVGEQSDCSMHGR